MNFDPDHTLAVILQAKFNEEAKKRKSLEKVKENLPVPVGVSNENLWVRSSLIDPEWEVTDPCPDIHGLFLSFNQRFFWGRLLGIEVKWSPQMTSCAGICVYEGRNGLCSVRLSAPLLKLRPRSDLVETLLHEMIHAYLFVTHNNRDRDGHGPEFHKHMNRINKEAGTNITVYHSFHAEVKSYQQHWWRCNGPCQRKAPFFGMVKRAKNRAPGPNDFWWADHQAACGGRFVKVREPEGYDVKRKAKDSKVDKTKGREDIRSFFKSPPAINGKPTNGKVGSNVFGLKNIPTARGQASGANGINHIVGFGDLSSNSSAAAKKTPSRMSGGGYVLGGGKGENSKKRPSTFPRGGMLANRGGGTLVVSGTKTNSKSDNKSPSPTTKLEVDKFKVFSGSGFTLGGASSSVDRSKSRLLSLGNEPEKKKQKSDLKSERKHEQNKSCDDLICDNAKKLDLCKCSVCDESMPREEIEVHMESCPGLLDIFNNSTVVEPGYFDEKEISEINHKSMITACPVCALCIQGDINVHLDECLNTSGIVNVFDQSTVSCIVSDSPTVIYDEDSPKHSPITISDSESPVFSHGGGALKPKPENDSDVEIIESENRIACMICGMRFGESRINAHVNECLDSLSD